MDQTVLAIEHYNAAVEARDEASRTDPDAEVEKWDRKVQDGIAIAQAIFRELHPPTKLSSSPEGPHSRQLKRTVERWRIAREEVLTLRGEVSTLAETEAILGPSGPALRASSLHPVVWDAAVHLWNDGHLREAVQAASTLLEAHTSAKLGVDLEGKDLFLQAFSTDAPKVDMPRLRFAEVDATADRKSWTSKHEGAQRLGSGVMQYVRNGTTHDLDQPGRDMALCYLATLSVVAHLVDQAQVTRAERSD